MLADLNERLIQATKRLRLRQKLDAMLREAHSTLDEEQRKCRRHEQVLATELADVQKLESFGLTALFYTILGTKDERLENERQEYLAAKLKHEVSQQAMEDARH